MDVVRERVPSWVRDTIVADSTHAFLSRQATKGWSTVILLDDLATLCDIPLKLAYRQYRHVSIRKQRDSSND